MQVCGPQISLAELNLRLAAAARQPSAADRAREAKQRMQNRLALGLSAASALVYVYDVVLIWTG